MKFISDQHHLADLEHFVQTEGNSDLIRLSGDMSPSIPNRNFGNRAIESSILKEFQKEYKKREGVKPTAELTYEEKLKAHKEGILSAPEERFTELVLLYGGATVFNLVRKYLVNHSSKKGRTLCLAGNEPIMDDAQRVIYQRIIGDNEIKETEVMKYIWDTIQSVGEPKWGIAGILMDCLFDAGIRGRKGEKEQGEKFILRHLSTKNYGGMIPTCLDVYKGHPYLANFRFMESIFVEEKDNCTVVHVPYFSREDDRNRAIDFAKNALRARLSKTKAKIPVINYHGNPYPEGMADPKMADRTDYNIAVIQSVAASVRARFSDEEIKMVCSHLHQSNPGYRWEKFDKKVIIYPLGIDDFADLNTRNGDINVRKLAVEEQQR